MALQIKARLIYNKRVKGNYFHCALSAARIAKEASPGQFVNIKVTDKFEPLLRRPFSIHRLRGQAIEILYEVVGQATQILSRKKPGEYLDIIGPLGNGFNYRLPIIDYRLRILVAGGMGVAPLLFLAERLVTSHKPQVRRKPLVLLGSRTGSQILCEKEFKDLGCDIKISTDDGSRGFKGKVTDLLKDMLVTGQESQVTGMDHETCGMRPVTLMYACGPRPMLKEVSRISREYKIPAQISLEEHMACGIGVCLGCVVKTKGGFKRVCKEGPVFDAREILGR